MTTNKFNLSGNGPDNYEKYTPFMAPFVEAIIDRAEVSSGQAVLDVACGTGFVTRRLAAKVGRGGRVVGLDLNPKMLETARRVTTDVQPAIEWHEASALEMPFAGAEFDVVLCQQGVQFFPDIKQGLSEMVRVLKPGGRLSFSFWPPRTQNPYFGSRETRVHAAMPPGSMPEPNELPPRAEVEALARELPVAEVTAEDVTAIVSLPSMEVYLPQSVMPFPWGPTFLALDQAIQDVAAAGMAEDLREYEQPDGTFNVPFRSHVITVTK